MRDLRKVADMFCIRAFAEKFQYPKNENLLRLVDLDHEVLKGAWEVFLLTDDKDDLMQTFDLVSEILVVQWCSLTPNIH